MLRRRTRVSESCSESGAQPRLFGGLRRLKRALNSLAKHLQMGPKRQRLTEAEQTPCRTPHTPTTPQRRCRQILGRTPTKLYSPFGIETPRYASEPFNDNKYYPNTPDHGSSPSHKCKSKNHVWRLLNTRPRSLFH